MLLLEKIRMMANKWLKQKTTIDFSDWLVATLFILGIVAILYLGGTNDIKSAISASVLWFTAIVIIQYTKETHWLKQVGIRQLEFMKRPVIVISKDEVYGPYSVSLKNIGKGPALNIELRITQLHHSGGYTNLGNLDDGDFRRLFNLGEGDNESTGLMDKIHTYVEAQGDGFKLGVRDAFAIIATYTDIGNKSYYTISLMKVVPKEHNYTLKTTKTGSFETGELEKYLPTDLHL
ncbi:MAG: hypothetical protein Q8P77_01035 [Candidatus Veblenbacteria bacterium]|nr:hypothetical protein [Candidatus Veblenbacteria bacterium]